MQWLTSFGRVRPELRVTEYWEQGRSREIAWTKHLWPFLWRTSRYTLLSTTYTEAATFLSWCIWISGKEMRSSRGPKGKEQPRFFDKTLRSVHTSGHESRECSSDSLLRATCLFSCGDKRKFVPADMLQEIQRVWIRAWCIKRKGKDDLNYYFLCHIMRSILFNLCPLQQK